jgi:hypothetical protein
MIECGNTCFVLIRVICGGKDYFKISVHAS